MARTPMSMSSGGKITEHLSVGVLAQKYPLSKIREILKQEGKQSLRVRSLPAEVMVYYVMGLGLLMNVSTGEVLRSLVEGLRWLGGDWIQVAGKSAISQARTKLGVEPLKSLWNQTAEPLAKKGDLWGFYKGLHLVALDGSSMDLQDTQENRDLFKKPQGSIEAGFPQLRLSALVECGPHAVLAMKIGSCQDSENALSAALFGSLKKGMLCLGDRLYGNYNLWEKALKTEASFLWRMRMDVGLPIDQVLADGSYLSALYPNDKDRRQRKNGLVVRVIEYEVKEIGGEKTSYRLITNLLDHVEYPAKELAQVYVERWEVEGIFDEIKTHLRGKKIVLRSKNPILVEQEVYGLLLAHRAIRSLMYQAALKEKIDTDRLSFTHTVNVIRRKLTSPSVFSPSMDSEYS
jgi:hypothetical protein